MFSSAQWLFEVVLIATAFQGIPWNKTKKIRLRNTLESGEQDSSGKSEAEKEEKALSLELFFQITSDNIQ